LDFDVTVLSSITVVKTMPPLATKIVLQPLDNELYHCDIATAVSKYLSEWQVLTVWTTLTVPCEELGGFPVDIFVQSIEPANIVLLRGEVPLELAEPIESVAEWTRPSLPHHIHTQQDEEPEEEALVNFIQPVETTQQSSKFIPFSGTGYRLGK
jgi:hypothetical protein